MTRSITIHEFAADRRRATAGDRDAAENYRRLAAIADDADVRADYTRRALEAERSANENLGAISRRLGGGN